MVTQRQGQRKVSPLIPTCLTSKHVQIPRLWCKLKKSKGDAGLSTDTTSITSTTRTTRTTRITSNTSNTSTTSTQTQVKIVRRVCSYTPRIENTPVASCPFTFVCAPTCFPFLSIRQPCLKLISPQNTTVSHITPRPRSGSAQINNY